jgi:ribosomal protein L31
MIRNKSFIVLLGLLSSVAAAEEMEFTDAFPVEDCFFVPYGGSDYFNLNPGRKTFFSNTQCVAEGECDEQEELEITVTRKLKKVLIDVGRKRHPVWTRVVEEVETIDGELAEISQNYFATCLPSRDVYYFGEDVDIYEDGEVVSHDGAWLAGRFGARPGMIMPDSGFLLGQRYFQEVAPGVALDRAEHVGTNLEISLGAGNFDRCIEVLETTPLEPGEESMKTYCPGVGLVVDAELEAIAVYR